MAESMTSPAADLPSTVRLETVRSRAPPMRQPLAVPPRTTMPVADEFQFDQSVSPFWLNGPLAELAHRVVAWW
jgi:hypothetical protein